MQPTHNQIIDVAEFLKEKIANDNSLTGGDKKNANLAVDAIANVIIGLINVENHLDRIATALEKQVRIYEDNTPSHHIIKE